MNDDELKQYLLDAETVAVIGASQTGAAHAIPVYLQNVGYEVFPVNPKYDRLFGQRVYDNVGEIEATIDIVDIFRQSEAVPQHTNEILGMEPNPELVWLQLGIKNEKASNTFRESGIDVVQDKCIKIESQRLLDT